MSDVSDMMYQYRMRRVPEPALDALHIDLSRMCIQSVNARIIHDFFGGPTVAVSFHVRNVSTQEMQTFYASLTLGPDDMNLKGVRKALLMLLEHELDECLYFNGKQFTDPHPELKYSRQPLGRLNNEMTKERDDSKTVNKRVGGEREAPPATTTESPKYEADDEPSVDEDDSDTPFSGVWSQVD